jgi:hypothetical protein
MTGTKGIGVRRTHGTALATGMLAALLMAITLSSCGGDGSGDSALSADDSPVVTNDDGEAMLACDGSDSTFPTSDADQQDCANPAPVLKDGLSWVSVLDTPSALTADESTFEISVAERDCTGAASPGEALHQPYIVKTDDAVTLYMAMDSPVNETPSDAPADSGSSAGDADQRFCEGNPVIYGNVDIGEPLGDRAVYDGSTWPPTKIGEVPAG